MPDDDEDIFEGLATTCPACGTENVPMGQIGNRIHYRCKSCGMEFSETNDENEEGAQS